MEKDFDAWNRVKKSTEQRDEALGTHEREIWWISLGVNIGVETDGKNEYFDRPVIVLRKFNRLMAWVIPTTKQVKDERFYQKFSFESSNYYAALTQMRTVSTKRFLRKVGTLKEDDFIRIKQSIVEIVQKTEPRR